MSTHINSRKKANQAVQAEPYEPRNAVRVIDILPF